METTGHDFDNDEIITIQWQRVDGFTGETLSELNILKRWDYGGNSNSELELLQRFIPNLYCHRWDFVFIGKNLTYDFCFLDRRMRHHGLGKFDLTSLHDRAILDIKPILIMINNGRFKGYDKLIPKTCHIENKDIPHLYECKKYDQIIEYIHGENEDFIRTYKILKKEMPKLKKFMNTFNG